MNADQIIARLERFGSVFPSLAAVASVEDARWKPGAEHWSILEIACHVLDEEREDFRVRLKCTLEDPTKPWPALDLQDIAVKRRYNEQDLASIVREFVRERAASVVWLKSLRGPDWSRAYQHPKFGPIKAGDIFTAWAAHDALHLRQIAKRLHQLAARDGAGFDIGYAGDWTA